MSVKAVTMKVLCEECDINAVKKELEEWYYEKTNIGMEYINLVDKTLMNEILEQKTKSAVEKLNKLNDLNDPERARGDADEILLDFVPDEVSVAYLNVTKWYS